MRNEAPEAAIDVKTLHAKIDGLTLGNDFLEPSIRSVTHRAGAREATILTSI